MRSRSYLQFVGIAISALVGAPALAQTPCVAPASWTSHSAVPAPDNDTAPNSNCAFHVWSWNTFLWMTQPADGDNLRFETFATLDELFADNASLTSFAALPTEKKLLLTVRANKTFEMSGVDSINQAGTNGVIVHGPDKAQGRALYYSQNVDPAFYEFVRSNQYYIPATYAAVSPTQNFPVGAMEFKYSWRIVDAADDASKFYTVPAEIFLLKETVDSNGKTIIVPDPDNAANVTVALVGVHVVGVVQDHPEFIWATFEHVDNAPDLPTDMSQQSPDPVSDRDWTFYHANTPAKDANQNPIATLKLDPATQMLSPTVDVFRAFAFGGGEPSNVDNLKSLNTSVQANVVAGTVWENYFMVGSVWGAPNNLMPNSTVNPQIGSTSLANATMETFDQSFPFVNCFACHNTTGDSKNGITLPPLNMNISHIMKNGFYSQTLAGK